MAINPPMLHWQDAERELCRRDFGYFLRFLRTEIGPFPDWDYLREAAAAMNTGRDIVWLKRRQVLASWLLSARALHVAWKEAYAHCALISQTGADADELLRKVQLLADSAPPWLGIKATGMAPMKVNGTSTITSFGSTATAAVGRSLKFGLMDEYGSHPYARANLAAIMPAIHNSGGQLVVCSTSHPGMGSTGALYEEWTKARAGDRPLPDGSLPPIPLFTGAHCRPDQDAAWLATERLRIGDAAFPAYYPDTPEEAFTAATGLVYADSFGPLAIQDAPCEWEECKWRIAAIDPGGMDPTGLLLLGVTHDERMHVYAARRMVGATGAQAVGDWLSVGHQVAPIHLGFIDTGGGLGMLTTLQGMGWPMHAALKDRDAGIGLVGEMLRSKRLTVSRDAESLIEEFGGYWWDTPKDMAIGRSRSATRTPAHHHGDLLDCLRYAVMGVVYALPSAMDGQIAQVGRATSPIRVHRFGGAPQDDRRRLDPWTRAKMEARR